MRVILRMVFSMDRESTTLLISRRHTTASLKKVSLKDKVRKFGLMVVSTSGNLLMERKKDKAP
jgi:hypothetical protein